MFRPVGARNRRRPIVQDDQHTGKDEFSFNELVLLDECPCLTIIKKDKLYFREGLVDFLSPARRGRGILVAPGFCPASRFLVGAKTTGQFVLKF